MRRGSPAKLTTTPSPRASAAAPSHRSAAALAAIFRAAICAAGIGAAIEGWAFPASAQQAGDAGGGNIPSAQAAEEKGTEVPPEKPGHLFGTWGGVRTYLGNLGINLSVDYITETAANIAGGLRQGIDYAHQIGIQLDVDWQKLADIPGFSTHVVVVNRAGRNLSSDYIGDKVLQAQEIYGAGFDMELHDVWFYGEEQLLEGRVDAVFGRVFPGMDFAACPSTATS